MDCATFEMEFVVCGAVFSFGKVLFCANNAQNEENGRNIPDRYLFKKLFTWFLWPDSIWIWSTL